MLKKVLFLASLAAAFSMTLMSPRGAGATKSASAAAGQQAKRVKPGGGKRVGRLERSGVRASEARFVPGEVLVKFRERAKADALPKSQKNGRGVLAPPNDRALAALFEKHAVTRARQPFSRAKSDALRRLVKLTSESSKRDPQGAAELVAALRQHPAVEYAEPNYLLRAQWAPDDPYFASAGAWGQGFRDLWGLERVSAEAAWDSTRGANVVVAVIDTGADYGHEDLAANVWENPGESGTDGLGRDKRTNRADDDGNGYVDDWRGWDFVTLDGTSADNDPMDDHGHGTHVAGTVAAVGDNRVGIVGVAPESRVMALKGLGRDGSGSTADLIEAIIYAADNGAEVINASWGSFSAQPALSLTDAVAYARQKDVLFVAAAGNSALDVGTPESGFVPASIEGAVAVSAFDHDDALASFSNFGSKIELAAPGGGDADPSGAVVEPSASVLSLASSAASVIRADHPLVVGPGYVRLAGTSMAAPHVAGVAALVRSRHPEFSAEQVRQALRVGSDDTGPSGFDEQSGYGRVSAAKALAVNLPLAVQLSAPAGRVTGAGQVEVRGTVAGAGLAGWRLEYRPLQAGAGWSPIHSSSAPVSDSTLAAWDTSGLADGDFELRVVATNSDGQQFEDKLSVRIDNIYLTDPPPDMAKAYLPGTALPISGSVALSTMSGYSLLVSEAAGAAVPGARVTLAGGGTQPVRDGLLATWDTADLPAGSYTLTLQVSLANGDQVSESVTVILEPSIHEGLPKKLPFDRTLAFSDHLVAADIDGDGGHDLVVGYPDSVAVYDHAGLLLPGWPQSIDPDGEGWYVQRSPAVGDLDGDGSPEVVAAAGNYIYAWRADGTPLPGWPLPLGWLGGFQLSIADINGDGANEIVTSDGALHVFDPQGVSLPVWSYWTLWTEDKLITDFIVADLDADGRKEIVGRAENRVANVTDLYVYDSTGGLRAGWPRRIETPSLSYMAYPAAGDLDGDGDLEIVVPAGDGQVHAYHHDGSVVAGWPQQTQGVAVNSPAVGDLDGDGRAEVVAGNATVWENPSDVDYLYAWRGDGSLLPGWPVKEAEVRDTVHFGFGPPVLADVDGDRVVDIVAPGDPTRRRETIFAYRLDGTRVAGFPKHTASGSPWPTNSPAVADLDGDGLMELAWVDYENVLYVWDLASARSAPAPWPMYRHDAALTGAGQASGVARPSLQLSGPAYAAPEGAGGIQFTVTRTGPAAGAVSVSYATSDGRAAAGSDYAASSGIVTFAEGDTTAKTINVAVADDSLDEDDEAFNLTLSAPTGGAALGPLTSALLTIADDDPTPALSAGDASVTEGHGGTAEVAFNVTLSAPSGRAVTVSYATADGGAAAGGDYAAASGTLTFTPGQTAKTVTVSVNGDTLPEPEETFFLNLSSPSHATLGDAQGKATITDDDSAPTPVPTPTPSPTPALVNVALASAGATAAASSTLDVGRSPASVINGDRRGLHWGSDPSTGSGWHDATKDAYPDWLEISFAGPRTLREVSVFSVQDGYASPVEPTASTAFTKYGVTAVRVEHWDGAGWTPVPGAALSGNNKVWARLSFAPVTTTKVRVVVEAALAGHARVTEVEAWAEAPAGASRVNHALASRGALAAASSTLDAGRSAAAAVNGDRRGLHWGSDPSTGSGWHDSTSNTYPDWLEVTFLSAVSVNEVSVFSVQDAYASPAEPTPQALFTKYGVTGFHVEHWTGAAWQPVPGAALSGNNKVWAKVSFAAVTTTKIRVVVNGALAGHARVTEVEAWGALTEAAPRVNVAAASQGATAAASSTLDAGRSAASVINGDRRGLHWGSDPLTGSGWHDSTANAFPDWLEVSFAGAKTISEVSVFSLQDGYASPQEPTDALAFSKYGIQDFDLEYWTGTGWALVPNGAVAGNNKVWCRVAFPALSTTKIRVLVRRGAAGYSRVVEVEAYG